jgi:alcohol dehydrogenase class IV
MSLLNRRVLYPSISQLPEIFFNKGSLNVIKNVSADNLLILVYNSISKTETYIKLKEKTLASKNIKEEIITNAKQENIIEISKRYRNWPPDAIVAIGGGIVLDSAKVIRHLLSFPEDTIEELSKQFVSPTPYIKLVSIPTTPNTGSEANIIAVTINSDGKKFPLINKSFIPNLAILDPVLLKTIPKSLMYDFIADIFTHAYEGSISRLSNSYLQKLALNSILELENGLKIYNDDNENMEGLESIFSAGHNAGIVAGNAFVGMIHALGHSLETITKISHGESLHAIFKQCLEWQKGNLPEKEKEINFYLQKWTELNLFQSANLKLIKNIDPNLWSELAINDPSIKTDPIKFSKEKIIEVITWIQTKY